MDERVSLVVEGGPLPFLLAYDFASFLLIKKLASLRTLVLLLFFSCSRFESFVLLFLFMKVDLSSETSNFLCKKRDHNDTMKTA